MKIKLFHILSILIILGAAAGCAKGGSAANVSAPPTGGGELYLVSSTAFTDQRGIYQVMGEIQNNSSTPLTSIQLKVEIRDAAGASLLRNGDGTLVESAIFTPLVTTVSPGQYAPFKFSFDPAGSVPATHQVTIVGFTMGMADRAELAVENVELVNDGNGWFYLSGEMVNQSSSWAIINSLAGAGLDANNQVMTADWSSIYTTQLAPKGDRNDRDRSPFSIQFPVPTGLDVTQWAVYMDADVSDAPEEAGVQVSFTNNYMDDWDSFHIVGLVTNTGNQSVSTLLVGGLYADDGVTLDATWADVPLILEPGAAVPFDLSSFSSVNWNAKQASRVTDFTVQVDPWYTIPSAYEFVTLTTANDVISVDGATWTFRGEVVNTSASELSGVTVVVAIYDTANTLVGTTYTYISPESGGIAAGGSSTYEAVIYFDPSVDPTGYTFKTFVQGDVK